MSDEAAASAAPTAAIIDAPTPNTPELGSQTPMAEKPAQPAAEAKPEVKAEKPSPSKSAEEAVRKANEAIKAKAEANEKARAAEKTDIKSDEPRAKTDEKPVAKESAAEKPADRTVQAKSEGDQTSEGRKPHHEPPARFNERAKAEYANAPDAVKEDIHRVISENEKGIQKYKEAAERYERIKEFDEIARKNGREGIHESLKEVAEIEQAFARNPIEGMKKITDHFGLNLEAVAAHIVGQNPNQQVQEAHSRILELEAKIHDLEFASKAPQIVEEFRASHERFDELADDIAFFLKGNIVTDLETAYEMAARFRPASNAGANSQTLTPSESAPAQTQAPAEIQLNPAGQKSVSGAPSGGVSPAAKRPAPKSNLEALKRAAARLG